MDDLSFSASLYPCFSPAFIIGKLILPFFFVVRELRSTRRMCSGFSSPNGHRHPVLSMNRPWQHVLQCLLVKHIARTQRALLIHPRCVHRLRFRGGNSIHLDHVTLTCIGRIYGKPFNVHAGRNETKPDPLRTIISNSSNKVNKNKLNHTPGVCAVNAQ